jgi:hypothetical protein
MKNHKNIIGPNEPPINLVPNLWITKIPVMMTMAIGKIGILGLIFSNPSIAETTVMDGVIIPSASKVHPPIMAKT